VSSRSTLASFTTYAAADRLDSLHALLAPDVRSVTTRAVHQELLSKATDNPLIGLATSVPWLQQVPMDGLDELWVLGEWVRRIGAQRHHRGEATILAYAEAHGAIAIIDDSEARRLGVAAGLEVRGSLWLVAEGCRLGRLSIAAALGLIDTVAATGARFPCSGSTFVAWAAENGLQLDQVPR
jgi:predicted nucleic acid-binding protein